MSEQIQAAMREVVKNYFDGQLDGEKWFYKQPNENTFIGNISGLTGKINIVQFHVHINDYLVTCYIAPIFLVPTARIAEVCEYIAFANYGAPFGNFEIDCNDGEVRYKTSCTANDLLNGNEAALISMTHLIKAGTVYWERYGDNLLAVALDFMDGKTVRELAMESDQDVSEDDNPDDSGSADEFSNDEFDIDFDALLDELSKNEPAAENIATQSDAPENTQATANDPVDQPDTDNDSGAESENSTSSAPDNSSESDTGK